MTSVSGLQNEIERARADVAADFEALGRELGRDERQAKARIHEYGPVLAGAAAGLGLLVGLGGMKAIKWLLIVGAIGGAAAVVVKKQM